VVGRDLVVLTLSQLRSFLYREVTAERNTTGK
jgi:hypothetical protein